MIKIIIQIIALLVILSGIITFPLPLPVGAALILTGLAMLIATSETVRRIIREYRRRNPRADRAIENIERHLPRFIKAIIDKTDPD